MPSEYTSVRVSMSSVPSACSGLMYSGVPIIWPVCVNTSCATALALVALATPKSITFTRAPVEPLAVESSDMPARMLPGFRSRWMMPFMCACWMASHTCANSSRRFSMLYLLRSQKSVMGSPFTSSITK